MKYDLKAAPSLTSRRATADTINPAIQPIPWAFGPRSHGAGVTEIHSSVSGVAPYGSPLHPTHPRHLRLFPRSLHVRSGLTLLAALALLTPSAQAQRTDFTTTPGVSTAPNPSNFIAAGVWDYAFGICWAVNGRSRETATLLSGLYSATSGTAGISFDHTWNFELRLFGGCFDGGLLLASIDDGAFSPITAMTGGTAYRGAITTSGGSARAGQNAFCGFPNNTQGSMVTSSFFTTLEAGTQVQFAFEGPDRRDDGATGIRQGGLVRTE